MMKLSKQIFCGALLSVALSMSTFAQAQSESLDKIVAVVNDGVITQSQFSQALSIAKKQLAATHAAMPADFHKVILNQLIDRQLQLQLAHTAGIEVDNKTLNTAIAGIAQQNKMSVTELLKEVTLQGMSVAQYKSELSTELTIQKLQQQEVASKVVITPEELKAYMHSAKWQVRNDREYRLEDILIPLSDSPNKSETLAAEKQAQAIYTQLKTHPNSYQRDANIEKNDLGWRTLAQIPTIFSDKILLLKKHDLMKPVLAGNGYHIVILTDIRDINTQTAANHSKEAEQMLYQKKFTEEMQNWLSKIRSQAFINTQLQG